MGLLDEINRVGYHSEMRIVNGKGDRISSFGTNVFRELTDGRYVTIGRSDLSRLLFETIKKDREVVFGDEVIGLQNGQIPCKLLSSKAANGGSIWSLARTACIRPFAASCSALKTGLRGD